MQPQRATRRFAVADAAAIVAAVVVAALLAAALIAIPVRVGPVRMTARMGFGLSGETVVRIPPFGLARARTHVGPARLVVTVDDVDLAAARKLLERPLAADLEQLPSIAPMGKSNPTVSEVVELETRSAVNNIVGLVLAVAALAAAIAAAIVLALRRRPAVIAITVGVAFAAVVFAALLGVATFQEKALNEPVLEGALAYVPQLESVFTTRLRVIERLRDQVRGVADQIAAYYADPRSIAAGGGLPGTYRVIHVADQHLDPVGTQFARSLAQSYDASLVIDTGDLVITGSDPEFRLLPSLVITSAPVVFVSGNHDNAQVLDALEGFKNVTVATSETVVVDGLRIYPIPDPQGDTPELTPVPSEVRDATRDAAERLRALEDAGFPRPDIVALHNPLAEKNLFGLTPLILSGHTHSERLYISKGTVRLNSGTVGGMPYDPVVTSRARLPHSASVLYYTPTLPRQLIAIDRISVSPERATTLTRQVIDESLLP